MNIIGQRLEIPLYFKDGTLFASDYQRIVHGERGDYVELKKEQIKVNLVSHFKQELPKKLSDEKFYYYWLEPQDRTEKIYWQCNTVNYADYKRDYYYIAPSLLKNFSKRN